MGEFSEAVTSLLEAFSSGLAIIKSVRQRRIEAKAKVPSELRAEELRLKKTLKKSRTDVSIAYSRDLGKAGTRFADGDVKAHSSLMAILFRLNAGFVAIIDRFTRGKSTRQDYQSLVNLSNASRKEAIHTFSQLSSRLSIASEAQKPGRERKASGKDAKAMKSATSKRSPNQRDQRRGSAPELGLSSATGKVCRNDRSKTRVKDPPSSTLSSVASPMLPKNLVAANDHSIPNEQVGSPQRAQAFNIHREPTSAARNRQAKRVSMMTFASASTKLGEIPEDRWVTDSDAMGVTAFPASPWQEPTKAKSRFMRIFRR